jgi:hypothetical protein
MMPTTRVEPVTGRWRGISCAAESEVGGQAKGKRQKAKGKRQKAEGRRQKAEGRKQKAESRNAKQKAEGKTQNLEKGQAGATSVPPKAPPISAFNFPLFP